MTPRPDRRQGKVIKARHRSAKVADAPWYGRAPTTPTAQTSHDRGAQALLVIAVILEREAQGNKQFPLSSRRRTMAPVPSPYLKVTSAAS